MLTRLARRPPSRAPLVLRPAVRALAYNGTSRSWQMLPSGVRWCELRAGGSDNETVVQTGQVVRVDFVCRLDDGTKIASGTGTSFRLGNRSGNICAALDDVVPGMQLGDTRRCRVPPNSPRGRALSAAPQGEMLEYDVTLTGFVSQMKIVTLDDDDPSRLSDDPLQNLVDFGKRSILQLSAAMARFSKK